MEALNAHPAIGAKQALCPIGGGAGLRLRSGCSLRARVPEPGLRGEVRLPVRRLRRRTAQARDPPGARRADRPDARGGARHRPRGARRDRERPVDPYLRDVLDVLLRMLHVTAGIAWIGASFYFVRLDLALRPPKNARATQRRAWPASSGECTAAASTTRRSIGSRRARCPSRCTGSSGRRTRPGSPGFALMVVLYYFDAGVRLVDPAVADISDWTAIALSVGGLGLAWLVYDAALPNGRAAQPGRARAVSASRSSRWPRGERASSSRRAPPTSRSARWSGRSWRRTSSS